jgi:hypothetical protein
MFVAPGFELTENEACALYALIERNNGIPSYFDAMCIRLRDYVKIYRPELFEDSVVAELSPDDNYHPADLFVLSTESLSAASEARKQAGYDHESSLKDCDQAAYESNDFDPDYDDNISRED